MQVVWCKKNSEQADLNSLLKVLNITDGSKDTEEEMEPQLKHSLNASKKNLRPQTASSPCKSSFSNFNENFDSESIFSSEKSFGSQRRPRSNRSLVGRKDKNNSSDSRLSMSFNNNKVRDIDAENHRLLKEIIKRKSDQSQSVTSCPVRLQSASAINRIKKQKEIERENLRLLHKIQTAKPTNGISRNELIRDHITNEIRVERLSKSNKRNTSIQQQSLSNVSKFQNPFSFENESVSSSKSRASSARPQSFLAEKYWEPGW